MNRKKKQRNTRTTKEGDQDDATQNKLGSIESAVAGWHNLEAREQGRDE